MHKDKYEVNLLINEKPIREYYSNGRFYVEARPKTEYSVKLKNHSHKKIMAIVSVDGIDVIKGKNASEAESGYIINPYSHVNITGYRINDGKVATFKFEGGEKSYATQVENKFDKEKLEKVAKGESPPSKNNGIIGVRIYEEKDAKFITEWKQEISAPNKSSYYGSNLGSYIGGSIISPQGSRGFISGSSVPLRSRVTYSCDTLYTGPIACASAGGTYTNSMDTSSSDTICDSYIPENEGLIGAVFTHPKIDVNQFGELRAISPNFSLGTTWGNEKADKVIKTQFIKAETYIDLEIFYLEREELIKIGVDVENAKKIFASGYPEAFGEEYCKQPNDWRTH